MYACILPLRFLHTFAVCRSIYKQIDSDIQRNGASIHQRLANSLTILSTCNKQKLHSIFMAFMLWRYYFNLYSCCWGFSNIEWFKQKFEETKNIYFLCRYLWKCGIYLCIQFQLNKFTKATKKKCNLLMLNVYSTNSLPHILYAIAQ